MANSNKNKRKIIILSIAALSTAIVVCGVFAIIHHNQKKDSNTQQSNSAQVDNSPVQDILKTESDLRDEEKVTAASNDAKDRMEADDARAAEQTVERDESGKKVAKPIVSFASVEGNEVVASGIVSNINELEGGCTFIFTKDSATISQTSDILPGPSYVSCETVRIDKSKFSSGTWTVKIQYKSNTAEGESEAQTIQM